MLTMKGRSLVASSYVRWFSEPSTVAEVGGKGYNLSVMSRMGLPVPNGFTVLPSAIDNDAAMAEVLEAYSRLPSVVAVRSSGVDEDSSAASFAGQHDTYLNVSGAEAVAEAIRQCWQSAQSERAVAYRSRSGISGSSMAVGVQEMVQPTQSGVMFTKAVTGEDAFEIEGIDGLGDDLVSGKVNPTLRYFLLKEELPMQTLRLSPVGYQFPILIRRCNHLQVTCLLDFSGMCRPSGHVAAPWISSLLSLGVKLEIEFGCPQDIEWARIEDDVFILQARPMQ